MEYRDTERPLAWRYGVALVAVAAATAASWALQKAGLEHPPAPFLAAILLCGWHGGTGPAILAVALSTFMFDFFFLPPLHSLTFEPQTNPYVVVFLLFAALAGWFSAAPPPHMGIRSPRHLGKRPAAPEGRCVRVPQA